MTRFNFSTAILGAVVALLALASFATAGVPQMINYQGRLTDSAGYPLDTTVSMVFTIYDDSTAGVSKWSEPHGSVAVTIGLFNVILGGTVPIDDSVFNGPNRFLGVTVGLGPELTPRTRLISVGYSHRVSTVDGATGGTIDGDIAMNDRAAVGAPVNNSAQFYVACGSADRVGIVAVSSQNTPAIMAMNDGTGHGISVIKAGAEGKALSLTRLDGGRAIVVHNDTGGAETFVVESDGSVGIGVHTPFHPLEVEGMIYSRSDGFKFPDGSVQTTAATGGGLDVYDSGWFGIAPSTSYDLTHNLGTDRFLVTIWVKNNATGYVSIPRGAGSIEMDPWDNLFGVVVCSPTTTTVRVRTASTLQNTVIDPNNAHSAITADQARVILLGLE